MAEGDIQASAGYVLRRDAEDVETMNYTFLNLLLSIPHCEELRMQEPGCKVAVYVLEISEHSIHFRLWPYFLMKLEFF